MSEVQFERRPAPTTTIQAAGQAVGDVTSGLSRTPLMLGVVLLNVLGIVAAVYFLNLLIQGQAKHLSEVMEQQTGQFKGLVEMHNREFDALLSLAERAAAPTPVTGTQATPPAIIPPPTTRR